MLNFNPQDIENILFYELQKSNLHVNRVGVMINSNDLSILDNIPEEMLNSLPEDLREDIRMKRMGIGKDPEPIEKQESMIIIDYVRPDGNEIQAALKQSGKIVLHFLKDKHNSTHYKSITNAKSFTEVPIILESQDLIERCECDNHNLNGN